MARSASGDLFGQHILFCLMFKSTNSGKQQVMVELLVEHASSAPGLFCTFYNIRHTVSRCFIRVKRVDSITFDALLLIEPPYILRCAVPCDRDSYADSMLLPAAEGAVLSVNFRVPGRQPFLSQITKILKIPLASFTPFTHEQISVSPVKTLAKDDGFLPASPLDYVSSTARPCH